MPKIGRSKAQRKREQYNRNRREEEYRVLAEQLHREWCERVDEVDVLDSGELLDGYERDGYE